MYFGVCYHPEHWVYPYAGTPEEPESRWERDAELMVNAGVNVVRLGEYVWGLCEPEEGQFDFEWLRRVMDVMQKSGIKVVLATPTAAPPLWLTEKYPQLLPKNEQGLTLHDGTRHAACLNNDIFWDYCQRIVRAMAEALGNHPQLIAWQIDSGVGGHTTEFSFNEESQKDWHAWLQAKYETIDKLNDRMGTRFWAQTVTKWSQMPMPMDAPTVHNPALVLDWMRFSSDTIFSFINMQAQLLRELTPSIPITTILRALSRHYDHFDVAEALDFVALDSYATVKSQSAENAMEIDMMRSLKKTGVTLPGQEGQGFWVMEQKAGHVNWQDVNSLVRPGVVRLFTYQLLSRGVDGILYFFWRQPRFGSEKFYGGVLPHNGKPDSRAYNEIRQIGEEVKLLAPLLKDSKVEAEVCILFSHENMWSQKQPMQPNRNFDQREHILLYYTALHSRNIPVDFARPGEDLSKYKVVIAPSLQLLAAGEADLLKLYVQNGGTLVATFNTALFDEFHIAPDDGCPHNMTDLFGMEVVEFDPIPEDKGNHLIVKPPFHSSHMNSARIWCDIIEPKECQVLATYSKDFYAGKPAMTMNEFGLGKAIYVGTMSHREFYFDLIEWLRQENNLFPLMKVPNQVEVSMRKKDGVNIFFLLNHQDSHVRINFYKPMHDFLTGNTFTGQYDLPPHGVLILDEKTKSKEPEDPTEEQETAEPVAEESETE
ncbi:MAG TPA: beta-galactosidase [Verrucomicrobia bacterium]|nr:beta-galactosidase [Verrucomicrobiota bacterium]